MLISGAKERGELEGRVTSLIREVKESGKHTFYIFKFMIMFMLKLKILTCLLINESIGVLMYNASNKRKILKEMGWFKSCQKCISNVYNLLNYSYFESYIIFVRWLAGNVILFIDEVHTLIGSGTVGRGNKGSGLDIGNLLKPPLGRGELQVPFFLKSF